MTHGVGRDAGTRFLAAGECSTLERESKLDVKSTSDGAEFLLFDLP
jgi:hypothetical protein